MSEVRDDRQYTETHEWILDNGDNTYTMGISEHAQNLLGDMVYVELPNVGDSVGAEEEFCVVESVKAASDVYAPAELEIIEVNEALDDTPELLNSSCYDEGWLVKFRADSMQDSMQDLMDANTYAATLD